MAAVLTLDAEAIIRSSSQTLALLFGYTEIEELIGQPITFLLSPPAFFDSLHNTRRSRRFRKFPCSSCIVVGWRKNGTALSLRLSISELKVGEDLFFCCLVEKRKDKSCLLTINNNGHILWCNKHAAKMFGLEAKELTGYHMSALCSNFPCETAMLHPSRPSTTTSGMPLPDKKVLRGIKARHRDGTQVTICMEVTERKHPTETPMFVLCVNPIDEERDPFIIVNKAGKIQRVNGATCKMFGYQQKKLIGKKMDKLLVHAPASMKDFCDLFQQRHAMSPAAARRGCPSPSESMRVIRAKHRDGSHFYIYLELNEFRESGETLYIMKISHAMHPRKDIISMPQKDSRYVGHYVLQNTLIDGLYGKVKEATHKLTLEKVVVKIIEREKVDVKRFREIDLMRNLDHPHIVKMLEVLETPERQYIVLDMIEGGELYNHLLEKGHLTEDEARKFWRQLVSAVDYMHHKQIAHRDLKLENLMLDRDGNLVVIDFGLGNFMTPGKLMKTFCGSVAYAAPEMFLCQSYIGSAADIWSMGVILYSLILGFLPFEDPRRVVQADYIPLDEAFPTAEGSTTCHASPELVDLIRKIFQQEPTKRITMADICAHPWTNKNYANELPCLSKFPAHTCVLSCDYVEQIQMHTHQAQQHAQQAQLHAQQAQQHAQQAQRHAHQAQQHAQQAHVHAQHAQQEQHAQQHDSNKTNNNNNALQKQMHREEIVKMLQEFGFDGSFISKSLEANELNPITASYYLLMKQLKRKRGTSF